MTVLLLGVWPGVLFGILLGMQHVEDGLSTEPAKPPQRRRRLRVPARAGSEGDGGDNELAAAAP